MAANETRTTTCNLAQVEAFLFDEAELLDRRRFDEWLQLFLEDAYYWVPSQYEQDNPVDTASLIYDDLAMLQARTSRLKHPMLYTNIPLIRTIHTYSSVRIVEKDPNARACLVRSKLLVVESRRDEQRLFGATCHHRLRCDSTGFRIAWKKVELANCEAHLDALTVPF